jgi:8-oxo-dGTP pyrophosphatase MutT (NUDIX family)
MVEAAGVGLLYQDLVLLAKRVDTWQGQPIQYGGYWSIFAGSREEGESFFNAAIRELYEETKIKISIPDLRHVKPILEDNLRLELYMCRLDNLIMPTLDPEEHTESRWFKINELDNFPYEICPHIANRIKKFWKSEY